MATSKAKIEVDIDKDLERKFKEWSKSCSKGKVGNATTAGAGGLYCMGFIGAAVYYIQLADGFWLGVLGILKAFVWPGFMVYELMKFLGM